MLLLPNQRISIFMVSYFRPDDLLRSVQSIINHTDLPYHLFISDNSHGGLDDVLQTIRHENITIHRNTINIGKAAAINQQYAKHGAGNCPYIVTIDGDVEVSRGWLSKMTMAYHSISNIGVLAPVITNPGGPNFQQQLDAGTLIMHNNATFRHYAEHLYYNRHTAGPLFLIDKQLFDNAGGYDEQKLYGIDDDTLCRAAQDREKFVGIDSSVMVTHWNQNTDAGYAAWKRRNVRPGTAEPGYWG